MTRTRSSAPAAVTFLNAECAKGGLTSMRIVGSRIAALGGRPCVGDCVVDLEGDRVLPGLINAHDHLQLNSLTRPAFDKSYRHVREWIADVDARRRSDPEFEAGVAVARDERLLIGGVKNLLSGVTTVAHHDPFYPFLSNSRFPIGVVNEYGWSHSLYMEGEAQVRDSYRATPVGRPWIIHAAEGLDNEASGEFERLEALGCLQPNTLLVHGIALESAQRARLERAAAGLIWCPSSNLHLFGRTADVRELAARGRVALGTDSRLSGARDLLDELRVAGSIGGFDDHTLESLVTSRSAQLLRVADRGEIRVGARADILVLPAGMRLAAANRADVRLVLVGGIVRYGDRGCAQRATRHTGWTEIRVDGRAKILDGDIARRLSRARTREPGLEISNVAGRAA